MARQWVAAGFYHSYLPSFASTCRSSRGDGCSCSWVLPKKNSTMVDSLLSVLVFVTFWRVPFSRNLLSNSIYNYLLYPFNKTNLKGGKCCSFQLTNCRRDFIFRLVPLLSLLLLLPPSSPQILRRTLLIFVFLWCIRARRTSRLWIAWVMELFIFVNGGDSVNIWGT